MESDTMNCTKNCTTLFFRQFFLHIKALQRKNALYSSRGDLIINYRPCYMHHNLFKGLFSLLKSPVFIVVQKMVQSFLEVAFEWPKTEIASTEIGF